MRLTRLAAVFAFVFAFAVPGTTWGSHAGPLTASCTNPDVGYTVNFPSNWFYNARVTGSGGAADIAQCRYFSSEDFTLTPSSEPTGVSIGMGVENVAFDASEGEQVTVGGRDAIRVEAESDTPGFEGTFYVYRIDLGGGQTLASRTSDRWVGPYEENKQILDAMMGSLAFGASATPTAEPTTTPAPTPSPSATPVATQLPDAALPWQANLDPWAAILGIALIGVALMSAIGVIVAKRR